jgi:hypothetical protein
MINDKNAAQAQPLWRVPIRKKFIYEKIVAVKADTIEAAQAAAEGYEGFGEIVTESEWVLKETESMESKELEAELIIGVFDKHA